MTEVTEALPEAGPSSLGALPPLSDLVKRGAKRTRLVYGPYNLDDGLERATKAKIAAKVAAEYRDVQTLPAALASAGAGPKKPAAPAPAAPGVKLIAGPEAETTSAGTAGPAAPRSLVKFRHQQGFGAEGGAASSRLSQALMRKKEAREVKPVYHPQWKLSKVISGHMGWVRAVAVDPGNKWFATGAGDRVIKVSGEQWDSSLCLIERREGFSAEG
jgi:pleiotropic regulator 1